MTEKQGRIMHELDGILKMAGEVEKILKDKEGELRKTRNELYSLKKKQLLSKPGGDFGFGSDSDELRIPMPAIEPPESRQMEMMKREAQQLKSKIKSLEGESADLQSQIRAMQDEVSGSRSVLKDQEVMLKAKDLEIEKLEKDYQNMKSIHKPETLGLLNQENARLEKRVQSEANAFCDKYIEASFAQTLVEDYKKFMIEFKQPGLAPGVLLNEFSVWYKKEPLEKRYESAIQRIGMIQIVRKEFDQRMSRSNDLKHLIPQYCKVD